jgi:hypothetical protein
MDDAKTLSAFLGSPIGGFLVALAIWELFKVPDVRPGILGPVSGEHLGPWHDAKTAIAALTAICTGGSWLIVLVLWASGRE